MKARLIMTMIIATLVGANVANAENTSFSDSNDGYLCRCLEDYTEDIEAYLMDGMNTTSSTSLYYNWKVHCTETFSKEQVDRRNGDDVDYISIHTVSNDEAYKYFEIRVDPNGYDPSAFDGNGSLSNVVLIPKQEADCYQSVGSTTSQSGQANTIDIEPICGSEEGTPDEQLIFDGQELGQMSLDEGKAGSDNLKQLAQNFKFLNLQSQKTETGNDFFLPHTVNLSYLALMTGNDNPNKDMLVAVCASSMKDQTAVPCDLLVNGTCIIDV
jgi:hypothetical protein